jgi:hypothetical protein
MIFRIVGCTTLSFTGGDARTKDIKRKAGNPNPTIDKRLPVTSRAVKGKKRVATTTLQAKETETEARRRKSPPNHRSFWGKERRKRKEEGEEEGGGVVVPPAGGEEDEEEGEGTRCSEA